MEQIKIFEDLVKKNDIWTAHTVIKNLYNRNITSEEIFNKYYNFLIMVSSWDIQIETRRFFIEEAKTALVFFSENVEIDLEALELIRHCRRRIQELTEKIDNIEKNMIYKCNEEVNQKNNDLLKQLVSLKNKLFLSKNQNEFDELLIKVNNIENELIKDNFNKEQKLLYDNLTKEYSSLISDKMLELNKVNNREYNKKAIEDFKYVFDEFRKNESKYKSSQSHIFSLVSKRLFAYDASKLFNESLIYYNHVYSYLFSKLSDDDKFRLTQISIDSEKFIR